MAAMYIISVRWVKTEFSVSNMNNIDALMGRLGDWIRFNGMTWLLWSEHPLNVIDNHVKFNFRDEDSFLVLPLNINAYGGWAEPWVWNWISSKAKIQYAAITPPNFGGNNLIPPLPKL